MSRLPSPSPSRRIAALVALAPVAIIAAIACGDTAATVTLAPVTGILIRSETLVQGFGCGTGPTQVFKYAAVVTQGGQNIAGAIYDCYTDGAFVNLAAADGGNTQFVVQIFAFSYAAYTQANMGGAVDSAVGDPNKLQALSPTWTTSCRATQQQDVEVLAVCDRPLTQSTPSSVRVDTKGFARAGDAGVLMCGTDFARVAILQDAGSATVDAGNVTDAASGGNAGDAGDAGDGAAVDAGEAGAGDAGGSSEVACPDPIRIAPVAAPNAYTVKLQLLTGAGGTVAGTTTCRATTAPGVEVVATCDPVQ